VDQEMIDRFNKAKDRFIELCKECDVTIPSIKPALMTDPCDVTDINQVRLNVEKIKDFDNFNTFEYYVNHVFIHYLCELNVTDESDHVCDLIWGWKKRILN